MSELNLEKESSEKVSNPPLLLNGVSGLGGWLVLVQIGLYASIILSSIALFSDLLPSLDSEGWAYLTSESSEAYHPLWGPTIIFEIVSNAFVVLFCLYILFMFYAKKSVLPKLMIILYVVNVLFLMIDFALVQQIVNSFPELGENSAKEVTRAILTGLIWIPYFLKSVRVRNTFVN